VLSGYDLVIDSLGGHNVEKSLTVLKPGGLAIGVAGPPDAGFARQLGAPSILGVVMTLVSRKVRKQAKPLGVRYEFFFMQASGTQLRELGALYDTGVLRPVIDRTFPFAQTTEAMAYVEQGRTKAGKVVLTMPAVPTIALDGRTVEVLRAQRDDQDAERPLRGEGWVESGRVFTKEDGTQFSPDSASALRPARRSARPATGAVA
jgi:hypothetical protein